MNPCLSGVPRPVKDFLGPPCCRGPTELGDLRIPDVREHPRVSYESSSGMVVACTMATDMGAPETMVLEVDKGAHFEEGFRGTLLPATEGIGLPQDTNVPNMSDSVDFYR